MAPNSGFAILLRSPWWVSFAIAAAIAAACFALMPADLAPFAAMGAVPIAVIGCMLETAAAMPWREFAALLERAWRAEGYAVQGLNGQHADLRLDKDGQFTLVAARRWKAATHGVEPLRALQAEVERQGARTGVYVALQGTVSESARAFAKDNALVLLEGATLAALLLKAQD
jgi:restriction system protein